MNSQPTFPIPLPDQPDPLVRIVQFAYEIGAARTKPRAWQFNLMEDMANVAEHTYRTTFLAMLLAVMEKADPFRAAVISMVHDCDEIRATDLTPYQKPYVTIDSEKAVTDTFQGTPLAELATVLFKEYKAKETTEAKCVKDADILDAILEIMEITTRGSHYLQQDSTDKMVQRRGALRTASGRLLFDEIVSGKVNPWDWFLNGPGTFKSGTYGK